MRVNVQVEKGLRCEGNRRCSREEEEDFWKTEEAAEARRKEVDEKNGALSEGAKPGVAVRMSRRRTESRVGGRFERRATGRNGGGSFVLEIVRRARGEGSEGGRTEEWEAEPETSPVVINPVVGGDGRELSY